MYRREYSRLWHRVGGAPVIFARTPLADCRVGAAVDFQIAPRVRKAFLPCRPTTPPRRAVSGNPDSLRIIRFHRRLRQWSVYQVLFHEVLEFPLRERLARRIWKKFRELTVRISRQRSRQYRARQTVSAAAGNAQRRISPRSSFR